MAAPMSIGRKELHVLTAWRRRRHHARSIPVERKSENEREASVKRIRYARLSKTAGQDPCISFNGCCQQVLRFVSLREIPRSRRSGRCLSSTGVDSSDAESLRPLRAKSRPSPVICTAAKPRLLRAPPGGHDFIVLHLHRPDSPLPPAGRQARNVACPRASRAPTAFDIERVPQAAGREGPCRGTATGEASEQGPE